MRPSPHRDDNGRPHGGPDARDRVHGDPNAFDRIALAGIGALAGAAWGALVMLLVAIGAGRLDPALVGWFALVFGAIGALRGPWIADAVVALMHFAWGFSSALADRWPAAAGDEGRRDVPRGFLWLGAGTALAMMLWWWT